MLRRLGSGAVGVVYEALDVERNERVALKTLQTLSPETVLQFKHEFRALQDLQHPNLVSFGELFEQGGDWFFTMELVRGVPFLDYMRRTTIGDDPSEDMASARTEMGTGSTGAEDDVEVGATTVEHGFDEARLRHALGQLARGLVTLHAAGKIHRDIKPSNILITDEGRGVLLDFGLVTDVNRDSESSEQQLVGTVAYMAPEQAASKLVGPEADWYSVGVLLYEALTGRLPFTGKRLEVLANKQRFEPAPPRAVRPDLPRDLDALCEALLHFNPASRPTGRDVLRRLGIDEDDATAGMGTLTSTTRAPPFVGRESEAVQLREAYDAVQNGNAVTVVVEGASGVGKSSLVHHFIAELTALAAPPVVLSGRCYERESVPYKAFDGVIDAISKHLGRRNQAVATAVVPMTARQIAQVFPVLLRVDAVAQAPVQQDIIDPIEQRTRMFGALRELLRNLAKRHPLVVLVDDLQWADADSLALLAEVFREPDAPPLLLMATMRPGADFGVDEVFPGDVRHIELSNLPPDRAKELAAQLLSRAGADPTIDAAAVADEAHGHPLFIDELVRHVLMIGALEPGSLRLDQALWTRAERLDPIARRVLELVCIAGGPLRQDTIMQAAGLEYGPFSKQVSLLRVAHLVRTSGSRDTDRIEPYHDRVREAVNGHIDAADRRLRHERLSNALEASGHADPETLAIHFHGAGMIDRAGTAAARAANHAAEVLAFDRAARLYQLALELGFGEHDLRVKLGDALANAGRGPEAGRAFLDAAEGAKPAEQLELRTRAAGQFLSSGHVDDGLETLGDVVRAVGMKMPTSQKRSLLSLLIGRARVRLRGLKYKERDASEVPASELTRIDICWTASALIGFVDMVRGADFQTRHMLRAMRVGEPYRIGRALCSEAPYGSMNGGNDRYVRHVLDTAREIAGRVENPRLTALVDCSEGVVDYLNGRWRRSMGYLERGEDRLRSRCTDVAWEIDSALLFRMGCLFFLGELDRLRREAPYYAKEAQARGDLYGATNLLTGCQAFGYLVADDPDQARSASAEVMAAWSKESFHTQHFFEVFAQVQADLYENDGIAAHARVTEMWPRLRRTMMLRAQILRIFAFDLRARTSLGAAMAATPDQRAGYLKAAAADGRRLTRDSAAWGRALGSAILGGVAAARGNEDAARDHLRAAESGFEECDMALHAATMQWRRGCLIAGDTGERLTSTALDWFATQKVVAPERVIRTLAPAPAD